MADRPTVISVDRRVDHLEAAQDNHERLCAQRYGNIDEKLGSVQRRASRIELAAWSLLASLVVTLLVLVLKGAAT